MKTSQSRSQAKKKMQGEPKRTRRPHKKAQKKPHERNLVTFGSSLQEAIDYCRVYNYELAAHLGVTGGIITSYIKNETLPDRRRFEKMLEFFNSPIVSGWLQRNYLFNHNTVPWYEDITEEQELESLEDVYYMGDITKVANAAIYHNLKFHGHNDPHRGRLEHFYLDLFIHANMPGCVERLIRGLSSGREDCVDLEVVELVFSGFAHHAFSNHSAACTTLEDALSRFEYRRVEFYTSEEQRSLEIRIRRELWLSRCFAAQPGERESVCSSATLALCEFADSLRDPIERLDTLEVLARVCAASKDWSGWEDYVDELANSKDWIRMPVRQERLRLLLATTYLQFSAFDHAIEEFDWLLFECQRLGNQLFMQKAQRGLALTLRRQHELRSLLDER